MSAYTRGRSSPQRQGDIKGQRQGCTQRQHDVPPGKRLNGSDCPFPNKPVSHRRISGAHKQTPLDLYDFERMRITKDPREHRIDDISETRGSQHGRNVPYKLSSAELQLTKAIHDKQLKLREKLWRVEEKIKHKLETDSAEAAAGNGEIKSAGGRRRSHQELLSRETSIQGRQQDLEQDQQNQERTHDEGAANNRSDREMVSRESDKSKSANVKVKQQSRGNSDGSTRSNVGLRSRDRTDKAQIRGDAASPRGEKYWERASNDQHSSHDDQDTPADCLERENHRSPDHKSRESSLPPDSSAFPSSRQRHHQEQDEEGDMENLGVDIQLLPCRICNRKFVSERLEKHMLICKKVKKSNRQVFNSYLNRTKGSVLEEFLKTHGRSKTPERRNHRHNAKANIKNAQHGRVQAGPSQPKWTK